MGAEPVCPCRPAPAKPAKPAGGREIALLRLALAVATTALFVLTSNFWLPLICSVVVETAIAGWFSLPK